MIRTTARLLLREFRADDWPAVLAYQVDPRYLRYYAWTARNEADVRAFVQRFLDQQAEQPRWRWQLAVVLAATGELLGSCGLRLDAPGARTGNIGYELAPHAWGHGYATEAAREMTRFGFAELGLHRIWAQCVADNVASVRVLEKVGLRREGHLREADWFKGRWWDGLIYGLLEDEWRANTAAART